MLTRINNSKDSLFNLLLLLVSFYPILKEALASTSLIIFIVFNILVFKDNFKKRYEEFGLKPFMVNTGFYIILLISCLFSDNIILSVKGMKSSILLLIFPFIVIYFTPKVTIKRIQLFSIGYITSNLVLIIYFFQILVKGMAIDRNHRLLEANVLDKIYYLSQYPYEFAVSKSLKHLNVIFETHQVYLSLNFLIALILAIYCFFYVKNVLAKLSFSIIGLIFITAIFYFQSNTTVLTLLVLMPSLLFLVRNKRLKLLLIVTLLVISVIGFKAGLFKIYNNKNTWGNIKLISAILDSDSEKQDVDKRFFIYKCAIFLAKQNYFLGYGAGDVQSELNNCYDENNYVVSEYRSIGSEINTHNYYLYMLLSSGFLGLGAIFYFFFKSFELAIIGKNYFYVMFLMVFVIGLLTENLLVRMMGVFPFAIINGLFYSNCRSLRDEQ